MEFNSFAELGRYMKIAPPVSESAPRPRKCRKCGADMEFIAGTNVFVCTGENCNATGIVTVHR